MKAISSLAAPLLVDENQHHKLEDVESNCYDSNEGTSSVFSTIFNGLNTLSGVGILSTPYALATGGWLSLVLLFVIALATFYTGLLIQRCMDADSTIKSYPDIGERAFGKKGRLLVSVFMNVELYLVATGFLILEGDNLHNLFPNVALEAGGFRLGGRQTFVIVVALVILPSVWVDNLSMLSYVSASGVLASAIILASIFWTAAFDGIGFHGKGTMINWSGIPTSVSLYAFCYCAHPVFPTLYTSMQKKHQFSNVLILCFVLCTFCYASMAILGYLMFGSDVQSQVTLNLPTNLLSSRVAIYTTLVNPIAKYALMVTPIVNSLRSRFPNHYAKKPFSLFICTSLVISNVVVALAIPFFGYLMTLVGAFLSVTASIILPCLCYSKISGIYRRFGWELLVNGSIVVLGVAVAITGTYTSLKQIIGHL
ncbi:amino acid transporter AVT1I isoform X2 [Tripterygium wilfordii]|uniref:amino acid transporter AVT1I isoform X2 n=1 Tax=Tripterygium wilfordii TaxID=458696 RepID=UPI0018F84E11|nr:amino acid transporter AVT1I isoform X2 [Tripterygium wilfordii]